MFFAGHQKKDWKTSLLTCFIGLLTCFGPPNFWVQGYNKNAQAPFVLAPLHREGCLAGQSVASVDDGGASVLSERTVTAHPYHCQNQYKISHF